MSTYTSPASASELLTNENCTAIRSYVNKSLAGKNYSNPDSCDNSIIAEEAVAHVVEQVMKSKYDPSKGPFLPWACTVAVNHALTMMRKYSKCAMGMAESYDRFGNDDDCMDADSPATLDFPCDDDPLEDLELGNARELYSNLAESYNKKMREVAKMILEGYTRDEIKAALGISDNDLSTCKCRIKKNFVSRLHDLSSYRAIA